MNKRIQDYISENSDAIYKTLKELCMIPAPSHLEHQRAAYCKKWLEEQGAKGVYIDEALNVIFPINCGNSRNLTVFAAHTDTVFPDTKSLPYYDDGEKIYAPGVSDDTASVVVLLFTAKFFIENNITPKNGLLFVFNSCEEGLGNLKGVRKLFNNYSGRIETFITLDSTLNKVADRCVGSHRYEVRVNTEGGHSFSKFGNTNAIAEISNIISEIYKINIPEKPGCKTTYNVGTIEGGTSVNTIAQSAKMTCEYRSNDMECLAFMKAAFEHIFANAGKRATIEVELIGERPCGDTPCEKIQQLKNILVPIIETTINDKVHYVSASTDCNIPLSLGVAALCIGANIHDKVHTREEWVDKESIKTGLSVVIKASMALTAGD